MGKKPIIPPSNAGSRPARPVPPPLQVMMKRGDSVIANTSRPRDIERVVIPKATDRKQD